MTYEIRKEDIAMLASIIDGEAFNTLRADYRSVLMDARRAKARAIATAMVTAAYIVLAGCSTKNCTEVELPGGRFTLGECTDAPRQVGDAKGDNPITQDNEPPVPGS